MSNVRHQIPNPGIYTDEWDSRVRCGWSDCENPGSGLYYLIECFASPAARMGTRWGGPNYWRLGPHTELPDRVMCPECRKTPFCCTQHLDYARRSHRPGQYGKLSAGVNGRYL